MIPWDIQSIRGGDPLTADYVAAGAFFPQKNGPHIFGSPELVGTLPQAPFCFQKNGPWIFGSPELVGTMPQTVFLPMRAAAEAVV